MINHSMPESQTKKLFRWEEIGLKIVGISLEKENNLLFNIYSYMALLIMCSYAVLLLISLFTRNFNDVLDSWAICIGCLYILSMSWTTLFNRVGVGLLLNKLGKAPFLPNVNRGGNIEENLVQEWFQFKKLQILMYSIGVIFSLELPVAYSAVARFTNTNSHDWTLRLGQLSIIDTSYSPNFELVWIYQVVSVNLFAISCSSIVVILSGVLDYVATQFKMLQKYLGTILDKAEENKQHSSSNSSEDVEMLWMSLNLYVKDIVTYHEAIIDVVKELEAIFSNTVLSIFIGVFGLVCIETYRASLLPLQDFGVVAILIELLTGSFAMLMICNAGENLAHESEQVANAAYGIDFVGTDMRFQKSLIIFIRKTQVPIKIKAGKLIEVSRITAASIFRASYSVYMALKAANSND